MKLNFDFGYNYCNIHEYKNFNQEEIDEFKKLNKEGYKVFISKLISFTTQIIN